MSESGTAPARVSLLRAETRRLILDLVDRGCRVKITPDGTIHIEPPGQREDTYNPIDFVDWREARDRAKKK